MIEMAVGELAGMIDIALNAIDWSHQSPPLSSYHSHSVDIADAIGGGGKVLRISLFSSLDLETAAAALQADTSAACSMAQVITGLLEAVLAGSVSVELPFSIHDLLSDPDFRLNGDTLRFRAAFSKPASAAAPKLSVADPSYSQLIAGLPEPVQSLVYQTIVLRSALNRGELELRFESLGDFFAAVSNAQIDHANQAALLQAERGGGAAGAAFAAAFGHNNRRAVMGVSEAKDEFFELTAVAIGTKLHNRLRRIPGMVVHFGQQQAYDLIRTNLLGVRSMRMQSGSFVSVIELAGLEVFKFLPPVINQ